jgi:hypothetical protein
LPCLHPRPQESEGEEMRFGRYPILEIFWYKFLYPKSFVIFGVTIFWINFMVEIPAQITKENKG